MRNPEAQIGIRLSRVSFMSDTMRGGPRIYTLLALLVFVGILLWHSTRTYSSVGQSTVTVSKLLQSGILLLNAAGDAVVEHRNAKDQGKQVKGLTKEGKKEFVTLADLKSHVIIKRSLLADFPGLNVVSEEHDPVDSDFKPAPSRRHWGVNAELLDATVANSDPKYDLSDVVVWIDPLDATQEYTEMLDEYVTIMMCVVVRGEPVASVIHFPFSKATYWQWAGHRASISLTAELARHAKPKDGMRRVTVSRSHAGQVNATLLSIDRSLQVIPAGGAGYKAFQVITNRADAYVHTTAIKKWDICVGDALLRHTGGELRSLKTGRRISYGTPADFKVDGGFIAVGKKGAGDELLYSLQKKLQV